MTMVQIDGITIAYDDAGWGLDTLLLVHGHPFDRTMWRPQIEAAVSAGWRVIVPDLRGYGRSMVVPGVTTLDTFATDLAGLLDRLGVARVVVGGLSMGGQIVMEFLAQYPSRVRGLLLAATFPQPETESGKVQRHATADRILREGMTGYAAELLPRMLAANSIVATPQVARDVMTMMQNTAPEGAAAALRGRAERPDYAPVLSRTPVPALVVAGSADAFTTRADADRMHALLANSELLWLEDVGHMPNLESTEEFNAALLRLLKSVRSRQELVFATMF